MSIIVGKKTTTKTYSQLVEMIEREKTSTARDPKTSPGRQLAEYKSWVSNCVSLIYDTIKTIEFKFYRQDTHEEINSRLHSYKTLSKPFSNPNPLMSMTFLKSFMQMQLDLCGMAAAYKVRNQLGQIWEIWPLNMNDFYGVFAVDGTPIEMCSDILPEDVIYVFMIGGKHFAFSDKELILLKYPHPKNPWIGASPVQLQAYAIDLQTYMEIYESDFFRNSARVDGLLSSDFDIDQTKAEDIKERWKGKYSYGSGGSFHDIAVMGSGLKFTPVEWANKDLEFLNLSNWTEDLVLGAYRTPKAKLAKSDSTNRSSGVQTDLYYARECIQPRLVSWDGEFTQIVQEFDPRIYVKHNNPLPRDELLEIQGARVYLSGAPTYKINEYRKLRNLPPIPNGDRAIIPNNFIFLDRLDEVMDANLKAKENPIANETDPSRHDDDKPHLNPDSSDDRDHIGTDGRSFDNFQIKINNIWEEKIFDFLWSNRYSKDIDLVKDFTKFMNNLFLTTIEISSFYFDIKEISSKVDLIWIDDITQKISKEVMGTIDHSSLSYFTEDKKNDFKKFLDSNGRLSKICNFSINSNLNYIKYLIAVVNGLDRKWKVISSNCGHKGKVDNTVTKDQFMIGKTKMKFPLEIFNLNCDCTLDISDIIKR